MGSPQSSGLALRVSQHAFVNRCAQEEFLTSPIRAAGAESGSVDPLVQVSAKFTSQNSKKVLLGTVSAS